MRVNMNNDSVIMHCAACMHACMHADADADDDDDVVVVDDDDDP